MKLAKKRDVELQREKYTLPGEKDKLQAASAEKEKPKMHCTETKKKSKVRTMKKREELKRRLKVHSHDGCCAKRESDSRGRKDHHEKAGFKGRRKKEHAIKQQK